MEATIIVQNLKCGGCASTITKKISAVENISNVIVDKDESKVNFSYLSEKDVDEVKSKLKSLGYPSIDEDNNFTSKMKSMVSCATGKLG